MTALSARWTTPRALNSENRAAWLALLDASLSPNPFYGPDFLLASEAHLTGGMPLNCLVVENGSALLGIFPLRRPVLTDLQAGCFWQLYTNHYLCLSDPLVEASQAESVVACAMAALSDRRGPHLLRASQISDPMLLKLTAFLPENSASLIAHHQRAAMDLSLNRPFHRSSSLERKGRKLAKLGRLQTILVPSGTLAFSDMLEAFLDLEAKGWKGDAETALRSSRATNSFARHAFSSLGMLECLTLDGQLIAGNLDLVVGGTAFTIKTAYDPDYAEFSPGLFLDMEASVLMKTSSTIKRLDSCASPGHALEQHWPDRTGISDCVISLEGAAHRASFGAKWIKTARRLKARLLGRA